MTHYKMDMCCKIPPVFFSPICHSVPAPTTSAASVLLPWGVLPLLQPSSVLSHPQAAPVPASLSCKLLASQQTGGCRERALLCSLDHPSTLPLLPKLGRGAARVVVFMWDSAKAASAVGVAHATWSTGQESGGSRQYKKQCIAGWGPAPMSVKWYQVGQWFSIFLASRPFPYLFWT